MAEKEIQEKEVRIKQTKQGDQIREISGVGWAIEIQRSLVRRHEQAFWSGVIDVANTRPSVLLKR